jgi:hypothetical protein
VREDDPAQPHRRDTVVPRAPQTCEKTSNPPKNIRYVAGSHIGVRETYHESSVRRIAGAEIHERSESRFRFRDSAGLQGGVNLPAREFRIAGKALYGLVPELRVIGVPVGDGCKQTAEVESAPAVKKGHAGNKSRRKSAMDDPKYNPARSPAQRDSRMNRPGNPSAAPPHLLGRSCADGTGGPKWNKRATNGCNRHAFPLPTGQAKGMPAAMQSAETLIFLSRSRSLICHSGSLMRVWRKTG